MRAQLARVNTFRSRLPEKMIRSRVRRVRPIQRFCFIQTEVCFAKGTQSRGGTAFLRPLFRSRKRGVFFSKSEEVSLIFAFGQKSSITLLHKCLGLFFFNFVGSANKIKIKPRKMSEAQWSEVRSRTSTHFDEVECANFGV